MPRRAPRESPRSAHAGTPSIRRKAAQG